MEKKGRFFDLYNLQMGGFQEFLRRLDIEIERHIRYEEPLSLILLEPTAAREWSEQLQAAELSELMELICQQIRRQLRVMDFCSLYTERRMAIALPQTNREGAEIMIARMKKTLAEQSWSFQGHNYQSAFHMGLSSCREDEWTYSEQLFVKAEEELDASPL